jgi:prophage regulatory protein
MKQASSKHTILRRKQVVDRTGICLSSIYNFIAAGTFPKPISLGSRSVGWLENEIDEWILSRIEKRNQGQEVSS